MYLNTILTPGRVIVPLGAETLRGAVTILMNALVEDGAVTDTDGVGIDRLVSVALDRDLVAISADIVLPHLRTELVDDLIVTIGVAEHPLRVESAADELEPRIVILVLAPPGAATLYLQTISALARLLRQPRVAKRLRGAASPADILELSALAELKIQPSLTVRDIMTHRARSVSPETMVRTAVNLMIRHRLRAIPVVGEKLEVLGIISEWDIMRALLPHLPRAGGGGESGEAVVIPEELRVREIMSRSVLCIAEEMGVDEAANMMINKDVEQFPVVSEGRLTGFLTRGDIIRKLFGR